MEIEYKLVGEKIEFPVDYSLVAEEKISSENEIIILKTNIHQDTLREIESFLSNPALYRQVLEYSRAKLNYKYMYPVMFEAYVEPRFDIGYSLTMSFKLYSKQDAEEKNKNTKYSNIIKYGGGFEEKIFDVR